jgi:peroxin-14
MIDKSKETQNQVLVDLQTEIKSLKSLLLNRRVAAPGVPSIPIAGGAAEVETIMPQPAATGSVSPAPAPVAAATLPVPTSLQQKIPSVPSIPSWQLTAAEKKEDGTA